jgi:hypothetical protein
MYQYNDRLTQLFTKYKYIWLWLQCFDPYVGHRQAYTTNLESGVHVPTWLYRPDDDPDKGRNIVAKAKYI